MDAAVTNVSWNTTLLRGASVSSGATGNVNNVEMILNVPANGSVLVNISGKVNQTYAGTLLNKASLTQADPGKAVINAQVSTRVTNLSALKITKIGSSTVTPGAVMKYQIKVVNNGPGTAQNAVISDMVPVQLSGVSWTASATGTATISSGQNGTGNTLNVIATIPSGTADGIIIDLIGKVDAAYLGTLSNTATVTPVEPGNPPVVTPPVTTVTVAKPEITLKKTGPATINAGANITYVIEVGNIGLSNAKGTVITDLVPAQISNVKWTTNVSGAAVVTAGASGTGNVVKVTGDIAAAMANKITITVTGTVDPAFAGTLSNIATATPAEPGNPVVVTPPAETSVSKTPALSISKTGPAQLKSGDAITYVIEVQNASLSNADHLTLTDLVPVDVQNVKWTSEAFGTGKIISGGTGTGSRVELVADLPSGAANKIVLTIAGTVSKSFTGKLENTARVLAVGGAAEVTSNTVATTVENADFIVPNIITPNGDGSNDTFKIKGLENFPGTQVTIFNRWGNEVYRSDNYNNDWDGSQLNEGTYYYLILRREKSGQTTPIKGWLFIKR